MDKLQSATIHRLPCFLSALMSKTDGSRPPFGLGSHPNATHDLSEALTFLCFKCSVKSDDTSNDSQKPDSAWHSAARTVFSALLVDGQHIILKRDSNGSRGEDMTNFE